MNILVVGSGGREHALCWAIGGSPLCAKLYCAPGNAGIAAEAECVPIAADDLEGLERFATENAMDLVVVGPEAPLVAGLVDRLEAAGIAAFGPSAAAARLEGSKGFMKDLCRRLGVPTADYARFSDAAAAKAWTRDHGVPVVVKADGLAAGKGVTVARALDEALAAIDEILVDGRFGAEGAEVVVESFLEGEEVSFFALVDGETALPLASAQDHKAVGEGDTGPNTGGMGAYSPAPLMDDALQAMVMRRIIQPTVDGLRAEGTPFKGVLYAGLMVGPEGPKLLEYNVRFGDPECQVLMMRLMSDIVPALMAARDGQLRSFDLRWMSEAALCVVLAAKGYPGSHETGTPIRGLDGLDGDDAHVFHAGTAARDGGVVATGGRVLGVTALGKDVRAARDRAYAVVDRIDWPGGFHRRDIGWRAIRD